MLNRTELSRAVEMQKRSYKLVLWMGDAVQNGFIQIDTAHHYSSLPEAAERWILGHYENIPQNARVASEDLGTFCAFFSTYLKNSFDWVRNPGRQLDPRDWCCSWCSLLVDSPNLKTKKVTSAHKRRARKMKVSALRWLATEAGVSLTESHIDELVDHPTLREAISLLAYGIDLLNRMKGVAAGPAVLALWRGFAWTLTGAPKPRFQLTTDAIIEGENRLLSIILKGEDLGIEA